MSKRTHDRSVNLRQTLMSDYISPKSDQNNSSKKQKSKKKTEDQKAHSSQEPKVKDSKKSNYSISKKPSRKITGMLSNTWAFKDTEEYRAGYPKKKDHPQLVDNYKFYMNEIPSKPDGDFIEKIHENWWGDYRRLEVHHGYIQWLFPIRDTGMNWHAQELQLHEIEKLKGEEKAMQRIIKSYKMMLDFYGMQLVNEEDGTIVRAENSKERFRHLNRSFHNYLRITRILKSLGEFGFEHLKANFVKFILYEGVQTKKLSNLIDSCVQYWIGVLKDAQQRKEMLQYYNDLLQNEPVEKLSSSSASSESGEEAFNNMIDDVMSDNENESKDSKLDGEIEILISHSSDVMRHNENDTLSCNIPISELNSDNEEKKGGDDMKITESQISETKEEGIEKEDSNIKLIVMVNEELNVENINSYDGKDKETDNENRYIATERFNEVVKLEVLEFVEKCDDFDAQRNNEVLHVSEGEVEPNDTEAMDIQ